MDLVSHFGVMFVSKWCEIVDCMLPKAAECAKTPIAPLNVPKRLETAETAETVLLQWHRNRDLGPIQVMPQLAVT